MKLLKDIGFYLMVSVGFIIATTIGVILASISTALGMVVLNRLFGINF